MKWHSLLLHKILPFPSSIFRIQISCAQRYRFLRSTDMLLSRLYWFSLCTTGMIHFLLAFISAWPLRIVQLFSSVSSSSFSLPLFVSFSLNFLFLSSPLILLTVFSSSPGLLLKCPSIILFLSCSSYSVSISFISFKFPLLYIEMIFHSSSFKKIFLSCIKLLTFLQSKFFKLFFIPVRIPPFALPFFVFPSCESASLREVPRSFF